MAETTEDGPITSLRDLPMSLAEVRVEGGDDDSPTKIVGYGAVFYAKGNPGTEYELWRGTKERIAPGAFTRAIAEDDTRGLFNHDPNLLLGRTSAGTMRLSTDKKGLKFEIDIGDTSVAKDVVGHIQRGDLNGSSFSFRVEKETLEELDDGTTIRTIEAVNPLYDVGPVTFPAYTGTDAGTREREIAAVKRSIELLKSGKTNIPHKPRTDEELEEFEGWLEDVRGKKWCYDR